MIAQLLYRDAGNYKTIVGLEVPEEIYKRVKVGYEFQIEEFGKSEDWLHMQTGNDYDPDLDHNLVEVEALYDTWEDFLKENPDYKEKPVAPVMPVEVVEQKLVDEVIENIKKDIAMGDYTVLDELLHFIPRKNLIQSLSEERWKTYETQSNWSEIHDDFEDEGFVHIDAWTSADDDEQGNVIAKINVLTKEVIYIDERAKTDCFAQEVIQDKLKTL
jgi:hypothetical protein